MRMLSILQRRIRIPYLNEFLVYNVITDTYTTVTNKKTPCLQDQAKAYLQLLLYDFSGATEMTRNC
jgi:hypothetical protein